MPKITETITKELFELRVVCKIEGFESFYAVDKEAAIKRMKDMLNDWEPEGVPLVDVSWSFDVKAVKKR